MGQRPIENYTPSAEAIQAMEDGDVSKLLELHRQMFGGYFMEGGDDGDDGAEGDSDDDGDDEDEDGDDEEDEDDAEGGEPKGKAKTSRVKELADENSRRRNENKTLKAELAKRDAELKKIADAGKSDQDKLTEERDSLKTSVEKLTATNEKLALHNAFLLDGSHNWHNPKAAIKLLDLDGVEIDDDGEVTGLDKAIAKLAKENPYLLKSSDEDEESGAPRASGEPAGGRRKKDSSREALERKYRLG